jgi:hypothetical protein
MTLDYNEVKEYLDSEGCYSNWDCDLMTADDAEATAKWWDDDDPHKAIDWNKHPFWIIWHKGEHDPEGFDTIEAMIAPFC